MELAIVGVIAVLLFGKRLPEVGRSMGKSIVEFKKGLRDIQNEVDVNSSTTSRSVPRNAIDDYDEPTAPKFEPPAREPQPTQPSDKA
jgi:sec-independent protein translocase protein TatA